MKRECLTFIKNNTKYHYYINKDIFNKAFKLKILDNEYTALIDIKKILTEEKRFNIVKNIFKIPNIDYICDIKTYDTVTYEEDELITYDISDKNNFINFIIENNIMSAESFVKTICYMIAESSNLNNAKVEIFNILLQ